MERGEKAASRDRVQNAETVARVQFSGSPFDVRGFYFPKVRRAIIFVYRGPVSVRETRTFVTTILLIISRNELVRLVLVLRRRRFVCFERVGSCGRRPPQKYPPASVVTDIFVGIILLQRPFAVARDKTYGSAV